MGFCWELPEGAGSKRAEKHWQTGCGQAAGRRAASAACVEVAALLALGPQQQVRGGGELCCKAVWSQQQALGNTQSIVGGEKGKEPGGTGNLKGSLGGSRCHRLGWEECVYAAGLLPDTDSADFGYPKGC